MYLSWLNVTFKIPVLIYIFIPWYILCILYILIYFDIYFLLTFRGCFTHAWDKHPQQLQLNRASFMFLGWIRRSEFHSANIFIPFALNAPFLYPLKTSKNIWKPVCIGSKWVKLYHSGRPYHTYNKYKLEKI